MSAVEQEIALASEWAPISRIVPLPRGRYRSAIETEPGVLADLIPVEERDGTLVDIAAFEAANPRRWWRRSGRGVILGADALELARDGMPLALVRYPLAWRRLRDDRHFMVACIVDWQADIGLVLEGVRFVTFSHPDLERRVLEAMRRQWRPRFEHHTASRLEFSHAA